MDLETLQIKDIEKNKNVYERIKLINQEYRRVDILNTSIAYLLTFKELKKIKAESKTTLLAVSKFTGVNYNRLRKIGKLFKASELVLDKIELFNKTKGIEGVSASVVCRILGRKGLLSLKIIERAEKEKWNTSDVDDYYTELRKEKENNKKEFLSRKEKRHLLNTVDDKMNSDRRIKYNTRLIEIIKMLRTKLENIDDNRGISFVTLINELMTLEKDIHEFLVKINNNCYRCKNCNLTFFTKIRTRKQKCSACNSKQIEKVRLD